VGRYEIIDDVEEGYEDNDCDDVVGLYNVVFIIVSYLS